jgi:uncharacterized protein with GYD domain
MKLQTLLHQLSLDIEQYVEEEVARRVGSSTDLQFNPSERGVDIAVSHQTDNFQSALAVLKKLLDSKKSSNRPFDVEQELSKFGGLYTTQTATRFDVVPTMEHADQQTENYLEILIDLAKKPNLSNNESVFLEELSYLVDKTTSQPALQNQSAKMTKSPSAFDGLKMFLRTIGDRNSSTTT